MEKNAMLLISLSRFLCTKRYTRLVRTFMFLSIGITFGTPSSHAYDATALANVYENNPIQTPDPVQVVLESLFDSPFLEGEYVRILNNDCFECAHSLADRTVTGNFIYAPELPEFSDVMAYHHINSFHNYVSNYLGFTSINSTQLPVTLNIDQVGADFSSAFSFRKIDVGTRINNDEDGDWFYDSETSIDLAKSADVLVHEYSHAIVDSLSPLSIHGLPWFLQEGWADYFAASYNNDPYIGEWINKDSFRGYRRSLVEGVSEFDLWPVDNIRSDGGINTSNYLGARNYYNSMLWSGFLWRLRERIENLGSTAGFDSTKAKELTDSLILRGIENFNNIGGNVDAPVDKINEAKEAIKIALNYFQGLSGFNYQYDWNYQFISESDIDAAYERRYRPQNLGVTFDWNQVSLDHREYAATHQTGRKDVVVAIIDTGLASNQFFDLYTYLGSEDLNFNGLLDVDEQDRNGDNLLNTGNFYVNVNEIAADGIDNDNNGFIDDIYGWDFVDNDADVTDAEPIFGFFSHGTIVTRKVADRSFGLLWDTAIMPIRNAIGGTEWIKQAARLTSGLKYAIDNKANVINVSQAYFDGTSTDADPLVSLSPAESFNMAGFNQIKSNHQANGIGSIFVAAAGNDDFNLDQTPIYPASFVLPNIVSVTGSGLDDNFGGLNYGKYSVDLSASEISTSNAAPLVSGAIALLLSEQKDRQETHPGYRSITSGEIKYLLIMSTDHLTSLEGKTVSEGRLNVNTLLNLYENDADWDGYPQSIENLFGTDAADSQSFPDLINGDEDGDGLVNHLELGYGSIPIPLVANTDYTGRLYPIYLNGDGTILADLTASDSDQDGLGDLIETLAGNGFYTDPANPDTDGDGLIDGVDSTPSYAREDIRNVGLNQVTTASEDFYGIWPPRNATDGYVNTYWSTAAGVSSPHWLQVELSHPAAIHAVRIIFDDALLVPSDFSIQFSQNGDFENGIVYEYPVTANSEVDRTYMMPGSINANYIRLFITDSNADGTGNDFVRVIELEALGTQARNLALGKLTTVSDSFISLWSGAKATDGITSGLNFWAINPAAEGPHWLTVDLEVDSVVSEVKVIFNGLTEIPPYYKVQFSDSADFPESGTNVAYEVRVDNAEGALSKITKLYAPISARYVRLVIEEPSGSDDNVRVTEFEISGTSH